MSYTNATSPTKCTRFVVYASTYVQTWPMNQWLNATSNTTAPIMNTSNPKIAELMLNSVGNAVNQRAGAF